MEKEKKTSDSMLKAINKYNKNSINLAVSYKPPERADGQRIKAYLEQTGQSANSYIKALIKADLDSKGFVLADDTKDTGSTDTEDKKIMAHMIESKQDK